MGDIPYHYGTWVMDPVYGWVWVPGYTWAPSWVEFREGPDYIGWAPVSPWFSIGVSFGIRTTTIPLSSSARATSCATASALTRCRTETSTSIVNRTTIINNNIRIVNNIVVNRGPDARFIERATRRQLRAVPIDRVRSVNRLDARGISRRDIRVDRNDRRSLRAAEPFPANRALPSASTPERGRRAHNERGRAFDRDDRGRRNDRGGEFSAPSRPAPSTPRTRDDLMRGRERQEAGTTQRGLGRGRMERSPRSERPSYGAEPRDDRYRSSDGRDEARSGDPRATGRDRARSRPDEGRMFRGVRDRDEARATAALRPPARAHERTVP